MLPGPGCATTHQTRASPTRDACPNPGGRDGRSHLARRGAAALRDVEVDIDLEQERLRTLRNNIRTRHALALHELMSEREDLHGVHPLADQIAESLRWSA